MTIYASIINTIFLLNVDDKIGDYFLKRVNVSHCSITNVPDVTINCYKKKEIFFENEKFMEQQEPEISEAYYYREIFDLGIFRYNRINRILDICYMNTDNYRYDGFEVIVDTILQFMYLIMLDFNALPIHASVIEYSGHSIIIFGNSGSGKTTLELALLNKGLKYFSDDIAFVDEHINIFNSGEKIVAYSKKTSDILDACFDNNIFKVKEQTKDKRIVSIDSKFISDYRKLKPYIIVFPIVGDKDNKYLQIVDSKEALLRLITLLVSKQLSVPQKILYMKRLTELVNKSRVFYYVHSKKAGDSLKSICNEIIKECGS